MPDTFDLRAAWESLSPQQQARLGMAAIAWWTDYLAIRWDGMTYAEEIIRNIVPLVIPSVGDDGIVPMPDMEVFDE